MAKSKSQKRKAARQKYRKSLAVKNPIKFSAEWAKFLNSKINDMKRMAKEKSVENFFDFHKTVMKELYTYGDAAIKLEAEKTEKLMLHKCAKYFSESICKKNFYRLSSNDWD